MLRTCGVHECLFSILRFVAAEEQLSLAREGIGSALRQRAHLEAVLLDLASSLKYHAA
jgi:hypothetical protein